MPKCWRHCWANLSVGGLSPDDWLYYAVRRVGLHQGERIFESIACVVETAAQAKTGVNYGACDR